MTGTQGFWGEHPAEVGWGRPGIRASHGQTAVDTLMGGRAAGTVYTTALGGA